MITYSSKVWVRDGKEGHKEVYSYVKDIPDSIFIDDSSPVGLALFGKKEGDVVEIEAPMGKRTLHVEKVENTH